MYVKMKIEHRTQILRTWRNKGDIVEVDEAVANRLRAHKLAKPYVEPAVVFTSASIQTLRDDGLTLKEAKAKTGLKATSWADLIEQGA